MAGESSLKDLGVWALRIPFPPSSPCMEEQTGKEQGCDVNTKWVADLKSPWMRWPLCTPLTEHLAAGAQSPTRGDGGG